MYTGEYTLATKVNAFMHAPNEAAAKKQFYTSKTSTLPIPMR
jgi:hypothetical protein